MRIKEFAEKYEVDRRSVDYWTNLGILHAEIESNGIYRDYGPKAEEDMKKILIAKAMGVDSNLKEYVDMFDHLPKVLWDDVVFKAIDDEIKRIIKRYELAKEYAKEIRGV